MIKKLTAIGNSYGLVIDRAILELLHITPESELDCVQPTGRGSSSSRLRAERRPPRQPPPSPPQADASGKPSRTGAALRVSEEAAVVA